MRVIRGDEHESMYVGDGCDLAIDERCRRTERFKARPLLAMPRRRCLVVWQVGERPTHDLAEIGFKCCAPLAVWQPAAAIRELVPDRRRNCALGAVLVSPVQGSARARRLTIVESGVLETGVERMLVSRRYRSLTRIPYVPCSCRAWTQPSHPQRRSL